MPDAPPLDRPQAIATLKAATQGLLYMSETDAPFEIVSGDTAANIVAHPKEAPSGVLSIEAFFEPLGQPQPWHDAAGKASAVRYQQLQRLFAQQLKSSQVLRFGRITLDVFVIGQVTDGTWVGIKTKAVET